MRRTLVLSLSPDCGGNCPQCPFRGGRGLLSREVLERVLDLLEKVDEAVLICSWVSHPEFLDIGRLLLDRSRRAVWLISPAELSKLTKIRPALLLADELVIVARDPQLPLEPLKTVLSSSDAQVGIWWIAEKPSGTPMSFGAALKLAQSMGLKLIIGETPYSCDASIDPLRFALALEAEVGLPMGHAYGYAAARAFVLGYPALLLLRPSSLRNFLYLSHEGVLKKHPRDSEAVHASEVEVDTMRRLLFSDRLPCKAVLSFRPEVRLSVREVTTGIVVTPQVIALLEAVHATKSLKAASVALGVPYSTAVEKIKELEKRLGRRIIETKRGGRSRGLSYLTEVGLQILAAYRDALRAVHERLPS